MSVGRTCLPYVFRSFYCLFVSLLILVHLSLSLSLSLELASLFISVSGTCIQETKVTTSRYSMETFMMFVMQKKERVDN